MVARNLLPGQLTTNAQGVRGESYSNGLTYAQAIAQAGGVALTVAPLPELSLHVANLIRSVDGVVLQGGRDIDPARYRETRASDTIYGVVAAHDDVEIAVAREAVRQNKLLLAVCRG